MEKMENWKPASLMPRKFRSVRDKAGSHRRNKSSEPAKTRPLTAESWLSIFRPESAKQAQKEKSVEEKEVVKVEYISKKLAALNYHEISEELIRYAIDSKFAGGDADKAVELLQLQQKAFAGIIQPYNPNIEMLGAENRGNVTCYLDALLFAMFAKMTAFERMLKNDSADEAQRKLAALLRLWVNMLRSGKLIRTDMTQHIQESLAACGWKEAELLEQQDTSEAFGFITETLQLPLLALRVDLFHQGKGDVDDHKVVHERLLNLAVPPDPDNKGLKLEDCLEEYFNNRVDVLRDSLEEKKGPSTPKISTLAMTDEETATPTEHVGQVQLQRRWTIQQSPTSLSTPTSFDSPAGSVTRNRSTSIIQRIEVKRDEGPQDTESSSVRQKSRRTASTVVKAVTIPAWQFYRFIPWHTSRSAGEPSNDAEVARHLNQRPVVGICLKRYTMTEQGAFVRHNTQIDIPDSLRLPHFMLADQDQDELSQEYKLVLQSVVCHRGDSLHSGHYISFARVAPKLLTDNRRHDHDPPPDYEEAQWAKFDDLSTESRVTYVDDIRASLKEEMPYLLFYQIVPMVDVMTASTDGSVTEPPSYNEAAVQIPGTPIVEEASEDSISRSTSGYFDSATTLVQNGQSGPSIRFSSDLERPARYSLDDERLSINTKANNSRRTSVTPSESAALAMSAAITPEATTPSTPPQEESTATRLSRAAAKFTAKTGSKSRPTSQVGEGRLSSTISRLVSRPSKETSNGTSNGSPPTATTIPNGTVPEVAVVDEQAIVEDDDDSSAGKEKHHHHHPHLHHKKDRSKSKSRDKEKPEKEGKGKPKDWKGGVVPDRECVVM